MRATPSRRTGFTLVEMLVSLAIVGLLSIVLVQVTGQTSNTWRYTTSKIEQFREARTAFETITTRLSQATLNTYWDYDYDQSTPPAPLRYSRHSELRFISGQAVGTDNLLGSPGSATRLTHCTFFHAPLGYLDQSAAATNAQYRGLENLLNVWGYFLEFDDDSQIRPPMMANVKPVIPTRYRFRLMELMLSSEQMGTYSNEIKAGGNDKYTGLDWFQKAANSATPPVHVLAENVIALVIQPSLSQQDIMNLDTSKYPNAKGSSSKLQTDGILAPNYTYDTTNQLPAAGKVSNIPELNPKNQLPPVVRVTMVAIDEQSAVRLKMNKDSANMFSQSGKFLKAGDYGKDMNVLPPPKGTADSSIENKLVSLRANYRIFTTDVPIRAAKWSREQKD